MSLFPPQAHSPSRGILAVLWAGAVLALIGAGLLLWSKQGEAVFFEFASSLYAMCF